jgi:hypothetical protein
LRHKVLLQRGGAASIDAAKVMAGTMRQCDDDPLTAIVMGVSGGGKSTIGRQLANRLGWTFAVGDVAHPPRNVTKLRSGQPLTEIGRAPWLAAVARSSTPGAAAGSAAASPARGSIGQMPEIVMSIIGVLLSAARKPQ